MLKEDYIKEFENNLSKISETNISLKLEELFNNVPEEAEELHIVINTNQENDGYFDISASVTGKDLYVINKKISAYSNIFNLEYTLEGFNPNFPMVGAPKFDVNMIIYEIISKWLNNLILKTNYKTIKTPIVMGGYESEIEDFVYNV